MKIKFDGSEKSVVEIINNLPGESKCIRTEGNSITIPTPFGAKQVFIDEIVVIENEVVSVIEK